MGIKDVFSRFSLGNLRAGSRFRSGAGLPASRGQGWQGAMHDLKKYSRPLEFKNLTSKDVETGSKIIEDKLKAKKDPYGGLNRYDLMDINHKYEMLRRSGKLSPADIKDFKNIASRLKKKP